MKFQCKGIIKYKVKNKIFIFHIPSIPTIYFEDKNMEICIKEGMSLFEQYLKQKTNIELINIKNRIDKACKKENLIGKLINIEMEI